MKRKLIAMITVGMLAFGLVSCSDNAKTTTTQAAEWTNEIKSLDGKWKIKTPDDWKSSDLTNVAGDLAAESNNAFTKLFIYTTDEIPENETKESTLQFHIDDIKSKRDDFKIEEDKTTYEANGKQITKVKCSGKKDGQESVYYFNLIHFGDNDTNFAVSLQTCFPEDFNKLQDTLDKVIQSYEAVK